MGGWISDLNQLRDIMLCNIYRVVILVLGTGICLSDVCLKLLLVLIVKRIHSRCGSALALANQVLKGQSGFTFLYIIWLDHNGKYLFEYIPALLYCGIVWIEVGQESQVVPGIQKDKYLRQQLVTLKNKMEVLVMLYSVLSLCGEDRAVWGTVTLCLLTKMKYGFSVQMQKIFQDLHMKVVRLLFNVSPLLHVYKVFYKLVSSFGHVYVARKPGLLKTI